MTTRWSTFRVRSKGRASIERYRCCHFQRSTSPPLNDSEIIYSLLSSRLIPVLNILGMKCRLGKSLKHIIRIKRDSRSRNSISRSIPGSPSFEVVGAWGPVAQPQAWHCPHVQLLVHETRSERMWMPSTILCNRVRSTPILKLTVFSRSQVGIHADGTYKHFFQATTCIVLPLHAKRHHFIQPPRLAMHHVEL